MAWLLVVVIRRDARGWGGGGGWGRGDSNSSWTTGQLTLTTAYRLTEVRNYLLTLSLYGCIFCMHTVAHFPPCAGRVTINDSFWPFFFSYGDVCCPPPPHPLPPSLPRQRLEIFPGKNSTTCRPSTLARAHRAWTPTPSTPTPSR